MKNLRTILWAGAAGAALSTTILARQFAPPCPVPCAGVTVNCTHQNGIRNHRGGPTVFKEGPNAAAGNVLGDAEWKIWGSENGMSRGSGVHTFTNFEVGAVNVLPGQVAGTVFDIPDLELRPVIVPAGVKEPDMAVPPLAAFAPGAIALPLALFRINVSLAVPTVGPPAACPPLAALPVLANGDVAMVFAYTPGETGAALDYYRHLKTDTELNTISNPSIPPTGVGNSYSGTVDGLLGFVTHYPISDELFAEMGLYEPTLEIYRMTPPLAAPIRGSGARELFPGDGFVLISEDWASGTVDITTGADRVAVVLLSDATLGSPLGLPPPGAPPGFLAGSLFLPGSAGTLAIYPTPTTAALLSFSTTPAAGLNCHVVGDVMCLPAGDPSVFTDLQATTAPLTVPPGLSGATFYAAAFYLNLLTFTLDDGSNTVEILML